MRKLVISMDGLSAEQFEVLLKQMPKTRSLLRGSRSLQLQSSQTSAQAIWAELLTGEPWFENGCAGYAAPFGSLNNLQVMDETHLRSPLQLLSNNNPNGEVIVANLPLLRPKRGESGRYWLSDGSLPMSFTAAPAELADKLPAAYRARPFGAITTALAQPVMASENAIASERCRMSVLSDLLASKPWSVAVWRLTAFDALLHLFGPAALTDRLSIRAAREQFVTEFDQVLDSILSSADVQCFLLSSYSHVTCRARINLNDGLRKAGLIALLDRETAPARAASERAQAAQAAHAGLSHSPELYFNYEARLDTSKTQAASAVAGGVFFNRRSRFSDGCVDDDRVPAVHEAALKAIRDHIDQHPRFPYEIVDNPRSVAERLPTTPDLIVQARGAEFHDIMGVRSGDHPATTHAGEGFVIPVNQSRTEQRIWTHELCDWIYNQT